MSAVDASVLDARACRAAEDNAAWLRTAERYGLPAGDVVKDGKRYCRHHPEERIQLTGYPCALCRKEGEGLGGPKVKPAPDAVVTSSFWSTLDDE